MIATGSFNRGPSGALGSIGILHPTFEAWGGAEWFIHHLSNALIRSLGVHVVVYTHRWSAPVGETAEYRVVCHRLGGVMSGPWDWDRISRRFEKAWSEHEVLFVHNHPATEWAARAARAGPQPPAVWYCHEPPRHLYGPREASGGASRSPVDAVRGWLLGAAFYGTAAPARFLSRCRLSRAVRRYGADGWRARLCDSDRHALSHPFSVIANSRYTAGQVARLYGRQADVVHPLLPHLDREDRGGLALKKERRILWVGRLAAEKRPLVMVDAWHRAVSSVPELAGFTLVMVGDGPLGREVQRAAVGGAGAGSLRLLSRLPWRGLGELYRSALVLVHLSAEEPFGLVPVEAMWAGTPVVAVCSGGVAETVISGETGYCLDEPVEDRLTAFLEALPARSEELERMGPRVAEVTRQRFDFKDTVSSTMRILTHAAQRSRLSGSKAPVSRER